MIVTSRKAENILVTFICISRLIYGLILDFVNMLVIIDHLNWFY